MDRRNRLHLWIAETVVGSRVLRGFRTWKQLELRPGTYLLHACTTTYQSDAQVVKIEKAVLNEGTFTYKCGLHAQGFSLVEETLNCEVENMRHHGGGTVAYGNKNGEDADGGG